MTDSNRAVFFISDRTGITAETLGHSLITQFDTVNFIPTTLPFIDNPEKTLEAIALINEAHHRYERLPLVFCTVIDDKIRQLLKTSNAFVIDFVETFIGPLEKVLSTKSNHTVGRSHGVTDRKDYNLRIEAVNYALNHDDGASTRQYELADFILIGVSRSGKTPTSLYLAMQFGLRVANYPITEEDMNNPALPAALSPYRKKLFGLTITAQELHHIRQLRRPNSRYGELEQCAKEISFVENLFQREQIPFLSSSNRSIEELATKIMSILEIKRRLR